MYRGAADLLYFCTILHFRYININIYTINFVHWLVFVVDWNEEKTTVVIRCYFSVWFLTFRSVQTSSFLFLCCCFSDVFGSDWSCLLSHFCVRPSCCLQCLCFLPLCFSMPKFIFVHKPNTARYRCFWHLHWDKHPVLNGLNIWQYPPRSLPCLWCPDIGNKNA